MERIDHAQKTYATLGTHAQDLPIQGAKALPILDPIQMRSSTLSTHVRVKRRGVRKMPTPPTRQTHLSPLRADGQMSLPIANKSSPKSLTGT